MQSLRGTDTTLQFSAFHLLNLCLLLQFMANCLGYCSTCFIIPPFSTEKDTWANLFSWIAMTLPLMRVMSFVWAETSRRISAEEFERSLKSMLTEHRLPGDTIDSIGAF